MNSRRHPPITTSLPKLMEDLLARALCLHAEGRNNSQEEITNPILILGLNSLTNELHVFQLRDDARNDVDLALGVAPSLFEATRMIPGGGMNDLEGPGRPLVSRAHGNELAVVIHAITELDDGRVAAIMLLQERAHDARIWCHRFD